MMTRVSSHYVFCSPDKILRQSVVERDENRVVTAIFDLHESPAESAHTVFLEGVISHPVISLKKRVNEAELDRIKTAYQYLDLSHEISDFRMNSAKQLIIDFGTENPVEINRLLKEHFPAVAEISLFDFMAATVFFPAEIINRNGRIVIGNSSELILWENTDLGNKLLKPQTSVREI